MWLGPFSRVKNQLKILKELFWKKNNKSKFFGVISLLTTITLYLVEVLFAISLQRFLGSANLIEQINDTRFFGPLRDLKLEALSLIVMAILRSVTQGINTIITGQILVKFELYIKSRLLSLALKGNNMNIGKSATLIGEISTGGSAFFANAFMYVGKILILILLLITLGLYSTPLTLIIFVVVIVIGPIQKIIVAKTLKASYLVRDLMLKSTTIYLQIVRSFEFLIVNQAIKKEGEKLSSEFEMLAKARVRQYLFIALRTFVPQTLGVLVIVFLIGGERIQSLDNKAEVVPYLYLLLRFFQNLSDVGRVRSILAQDWPNIIALINNVQHVNESCVYEQGEVKKEIDLEHNSIGATGVIMKGVRYRWPRGKGVLLVENINILPGDFISLEGDSGIGKTTFIRLITGFLKPNEGNIEFTRQIISKAGTPAILDGHKDFRVDRESAHIAYLPSDTPIISGTVYENLQFGLRRGLTELEAIRALEDVGLQLNQPGESLLEVEIKESGIGLSAGQRQRLGFARALLQNPKLLILDESFGQIDHDSRQKLFQILLQIKDSITIISVSHNYSFDGITSSTLVVLKEGDETFVKYKGEKN